MSKDTILFLCQHGGAKSVAAAAYFNRLAEESGLGYVAVSAATEDPYLAVPAPVADRLDRDGLDVRDFRPRQVEAGEITSAARVVSIGCDLTELVTGSARVEQWNDVPQASEDLEGSVSAIRRHVALLAEALRGR
jgi:protein-tyrosine-phosphatase